MGAMHLGIKVTRQQEDVIKEIQNLAIEIQQLAHF
jgi:hypothetical protein